MVVETTRLYLLDPTFDFPRRFLFAAWIEPFDHLLVARALLNLGFEIVILHTFETEQHIIERTIEMMFADVPRHERAAFIDGAAKDGIAAYSNTRTPRVFLWLNLFH